MDDKSFILFVIPSKSDKESTKMAIQNYQGKRVYTLKHMEESISSDNINLIILDNDLITTKQDESLIRWVTTRKMIPVIMIVNSNEEALKAIEMEALDFMVKPINSQLLIYRINKAFHNMEESKLNTKMNITINDKLKEKTKQLSEIQARIIDVISEIIEFRDFITSTHNVRTQAYVKLMIRKMIEIQNPYQREICLWDIDEHILSAQLHDIGKVMIPNEILMKPGPLTPEEYENVKKHVNTGICIIDKIIKKVGKNSYLSIARKYIESHHEHWDGKGYPNGLSGTNIPLEGRILAIVDAYDVITSERSYKKVQSHEDAAKIINEQSGKQFDPELVKVFNASSKEFKFLSRMNT